MLLRWEMLLARFALTLALGFAALCYAQDGLPLHPPQKQRKEDEAILAAASLGKLHELQQSIYAGADIEARDGKDGNTPLIWASFYGHLDIVEELVKKRADVNALSHDSHKTALLLASYSGHADVVEYLLKKGADINHANSRGDTSVAIAAYMNRTNVVDVLLRSRANVKKRTIAHHYQPLHLAAYKGHTAVTRQLLDFYRVVLEENGDIDAKDKQDNSPFLLAVMQGKTDTARVLLEAGADAAATDRMGNGALMLAVNKGHLETLEMLLEWLQFRGDSVRPGDSSGVTTDFSAVASVAVQWHLELANEDKQTPLFRACLKGYTPLFRLLLIRGANLDHRDKEGRDCSTVAQASDWKEINRLIVEYRATETPSNKPSANNIEL